jgi:hypothetical protein
VTAVCEQATNGGAQRGFNSRIVNRTPFIATGLTAGLNPQNSVLSRNRRTRRGRKQYPRKSNFTFGCLSLRFLCLQYTIFVLVRCNSRWHSARRT